MQDLLKKGYSGRTIRYWLLSHNYRKPLHFTFTALDQTKGALKRLDQCVYRLNRIDDGRPYGELDQLLYDLRTGFTEAMDDDLDLAQAMAAVFRNVRVINRLVTDGQLDTEGAKRIKKELIRINEVVNIFRFEESMPDTRAQTLIRERDEARRNKDWARADAIREELKTLGVEIKDKKLKE